MINVSIIVPVYNGKKYIAGCLKSALAQTYRDIEVIVVDDGSTDNTVEVCKKIQKRDKRLKIISKKNGGVSSARNMGIKKANGKYLFFLDADDYMGKNVVRDLLSGRSRKFVLVGCGVEAIYSYGSKTLKREPTYSKDEFYKQILAGDLQGFSCGYLFDTEICRKVLFDESLIYCEDLVFVSKYIEKAKTKSVNFVNKKQCMLQYVQRDDSATLSKERIFDNLTSMHNAMAMFNKITKYNYEQQVVNKKVILYESELQKLTSVRDYKTVSNKFSLSKYGGNSLRYKVFSFFYRNKLSVMLFLYYKVRKMAQGVKRSLV